MIDENTVLLEYPQTIRSVTPGQEAVLYDGDTVIGGGKIDQVFKNGEDLMEKIEGMVHA